MDYEMYEDRNSREKRLGLIYDKRIQRVFHCTRQKRSIYYLTMRDGNGNYYFPRKRKGTEVPLFGLDTNVPDGHGVSGHSGKQVSGKKFEKRNEKNFSKERGKRRRVSEELENMMGELSDYNAKLPKLLQSALGNDRQCFKKSVYKDTLRKNFRANMRIGFLEERIQREQTQFLVETGKIHDLKTRIVNLREEFDKYVEIDHTSTMEIMDSAKNVVKVNQNKLNHLQSTVSDLGSIKNEMNELLEDYEKCKFCERFLNTISSHGQNRSVEWKSFSGSTPDAVQGDEPELRFKDTDEFYKLFYELEFTCHRLIEQVLELELLCENTQELSSHTECAFNELMKNLEDMRIKLENGIKEEEKACEEAKSHALNLIGGSFYDIIAGRETLLISNYLQEVYQLCFVSSVYSLSPSEMFSAIEQEYRSLQFEEDTFPAALYQGFVMKHRLKNIKEMELSKKMRKELIEINAKTQAYLKLLEPAKKIVSKKLMQRSDLLEKSVKARLTTPPILDKEKLYLLLFTNRCDIESLTRHNVNVDQTFIDKYFPK